MGSHDQRKLTRSELPPQVGRPGGRSRTGQQADRHRLAGQEGLHRREVLLGQGLGRSHQRPLVAVLDGPKQRVERYHGLARPHLAHQQPLHGSADR